MHEFSSLKAVMKDLRSGKPSKETKRKVINSILPVGRAIGAHTGTPLMMEGLSRAATSMLKQVYGSGDYNTNCDMVDSNSLFLGKKQSSASISFDKSNGTFKFAHREYIKDISAPVVTGFHNSPLAINPGLALSFPFLADLANNFSEYCFSGLVFEYITETAPFNTTGPMGSITMTYDPNSSDTPYASKQEALNSGNAISGIPSRNMLFGIECKDQPMNGLFVRSGPSPLPLVETDIGSLQIITDLPSTYVADSKLGELWVTYTITFRIPHISNNEFGYYHARRSRNLPVGFYTIAMGDAITAPPVALGALEGTTIEDDLSSGKMIFPNAIPGDIYQVVVIQTYPLSATIQDATSLSWTGYNMTELPIIDNNTESSMSTPVTPGMSTNQLVTVSYWKVEEALSGVTNQITLNGQYVQIFANQNVIIDVIVTVIGYNIPVLSL